MLAEQLEKAAANQYHKYRTIKYTLKPTFSTSSNSNHIFILSLGNASAAEGLRSRIASIEHSDKETN
uniref:Uncharacterized protein n=1 Tax=Rhizophora mucronata TaxID=61149 RepID=A0A2P2QCC0_RHIMU